MVLPKAIIIVGPTASGKTALGVALAKEYNGAIVSADSRQVYRGMSIGTGKEIDGGLSPLFKGGQRGVTTVRGVAQYMVDLVNPNEPYSLADYQRDAKVAMEEIWRQEKLPIIVGGTGLYIWSLVDHLDLPSTPPDEALRAALKERLQKNGVEDLFVELERLDPATAAVIERDNPRRVIRALEFVHATGRSFLEAQKKKPPFFDALQIGIEVPRDELDRRIDARVDAMIVSGLEEETLGLLKGFPPFSLLRPSGYGGQARGSDLSSEALAKEERGLCLNDVTTPSPSLKRRGAMSYPSSFSGIGYAEMIAVIEGRMARTDAITQIKKRTRNYARRQMTWFRRDRRIKWVQSGEEALDHAQHFVHSERL